MKYTLKLFQKHRFVEEEHIPYIHAFQHFPEEMKLYGRDKGIFAIEVNYFLFYFVVTYETLE